MRNTTVVNIRQESFDVYIGRIGLNGDGYFGNPFRLEPGLSRAQCLEWYRLWFLRRIENDPEFRRRVLALRGKRLGCFCAPLACHGDVIAEWLDAQPEESNHT